MDIRHLQYFIAVADEGSFTRAARKVHIVQSGISSSIKELEEEVGVRLIERTTRSVALTEAGKVFLQHARASLASIEEGLQSVREFDGVVRGRLRIGVLQSLIPYLDMPLVLKKIRSEYPLLEIEVRSVTADAVPDMVRSGELDLSFHARHGSPLLPGLIVLPFIEDTLVGICGIDHPLATKDKVSMEIISRENFVDLTPGRATRRMIDREFSIRNLHRRTVIEVGEVHTVVQFVSRGLGVAIVPSVLALAFPESSDLKVLSVSDRQPSLEKWGLAIITKARAKGKQPPTAVNLFLAAMKKAAKFPVKRSLRV